MGKAHKLSDWIPIDANAAVNMQRSRSEYYANTHVKS
jgi:hypothetical protein